MFDKELNIQEYLSIGYLYLVVLGVLNDAIFYGILGFPIIDYTSILDALISPVALLTRDYRITVPIIVLFMIMYFYLNKWGPSIHQKNRDKKWYRKMTNIEKVDKRYELLENQKNSFIGYLFLFTFLFLSLRLGMAIGVKGRMGGDNFKENYTLIFKDNSKMNVRKIGQNSAYIFYIENNEKVIVATPIVDNIKQMKKINKSK